MTLQQRRSINFRSHEPAAMPPADDGPSVQPHGIRKGRQGISFPSVMHFHHTAGVISLLLRRGPATIRWSIVAAGINAVQGHALGARAHVSEEIFEAVSPTLANDNSFSAPQMKPRICGSITAALHRAPCRILGSTFAAGRRSVAGLSVCRPLSLETPATSGVTALEIRRSYNRGASTLARALPSALFPLARSGMHHRQMAKNSTSKILFSHRNTVTHRGGL